jgi:AcrR family transcriptional regulator
MEATVRTRMTRAEQQQLTRQRLLDATLGVVRQRGLREATIEEIAEIAGYTRGAFYAHFESKEAALLEVLELHAEAQMAAFRADLLGAPSEAEAVRVLVSMLVRGPDGSRGRVREVGELIAAIRRSDELRQRALELQRSLDLVLGECVEDLCARRGKPAPHPRAELGAIVASLADGFATRAWLDSEAEAGRLFTAALDLVLGA